MTRHYVALTIQPWEALSVNGAQLSAPGDSELVGFLPVFQDREAAERWADPGCDIVAVELKDAREEAR